MASPAANYRLPATKRLRVAIVHDWFVGGGAEQVARQLHKLFPDAPIYTSYCNREWQKKLAPAKVVTGFLQHWPFSKLRKYIPFLRIWWFSRLDLSDYDLVISSSGAEAKGIRVKKPAIHINYCHAPTHYYWERYEQYLAHPGFGRLDPLARLGLKLLVGPLRRWDKMAAQRPDYMLANSNYTKDQIKKYYGRDSTIVHPPVDTRRHQLLKARHGFVVAGRQTPYKRFDLAIEAAGQLNAPLLVIGRGPDHKKLVKLAGRNVTFLTKVSNEELPRRFAEARAFIFPGIDDFGIVAVEAMAAGTPVIAYKGGGALDYVVPGKSGLFFESQTSGSLAKTLREFNPSKFNSQEIARRAQAFSEKQFERNIKQYLQLVNIRV